MGNVLTGIVWFLTDRVFWRRVQSLRRKAYERGRGNGTADRLGQRRPGRTRPADAAGVRRTARHRAAPSESGGPPANPAEHRAGARSIRAADRPESRAVAG